MSCAANFRSCGSLAATEAKWPHGAVARRMLAAVMPYASEHFITPMAAVAGAVAEEILAAMVSVADVSRAYVNDGGDIALHLTADEKFVVGMVERPDRPSLCGHDYSELGRSGPRNRDQRMARAQLFTGNRRCGDRACGSRGSGRCSGDDHRQRGRPAGASGDRSSSGSRTRARQRSRRSLGDAGSSAS